MSTQNKSLLAVAPLFLVLFIDGMGLGLLFPILNSIIVDPATHFFSFEMTANVRSVLYGLTVGIFMICWFFGAAILGDLSDTIGRRKSLLVCLLGAFLGYLFSAIAIVIHSFSLLLIGRIIAGFTAGSQPIAQAAIVDVSTEENKTRNIGLILLAVSLGFVFGPMLGGILSDDRILSWFSYSTPLYFASLISFINAVLLWLFFKETFPKAEKIKIRIDRAMTIFVSAFRHKKVWQLSIVLLIMIFGWSSYFTFIPMYLFHEYHYDAIHNSLYMTVLGAGFSLGCGYLVNICAKRFKMRNSVAGGLLVTSIATLTTLLFKAQFIIWLSSFIIGISLSIAYSTIIAIFSNQVSDKEQGWVMGVTGSVMALCFGLTSFFVGVIAHYGASIPIIMAFLGLVISGILMYFIPLGEQRGSIKS